MTKNIIIKEIGIGIKKPEITEIIKKEIIIEGIGNNMNINNNVININIGKSKKEIIDIKRKNINYKKGEEKVIRIEGIDKKVIGNEINKIIEIKKIDDYKGKGIRERLMIPKLKAIKKKK